MAGPWYIDPGLVGGTNAGTSWTNAFNATDGTAWATAITASSAGDDFYVNAASTNTNTTSQTLTFKGTAAAPNRVFSCSTLTGAPPILADLGRGAAYTTTGASSITIRGYVYIWGVDFNCGTGTSAASFSLANTTAEQYYDNCKFNLLATVANCLINIGSANNCSMTWNNTVCTFNGGTGSGLVMSNGPFLWKNTASAILGTQSAISNLFQDNNNLAGTLICDSVDFKNGTGIASGKNLVGSYQTGRAIQFINCLITSGVLITTPTTPHVIIDQIVTDSAATNYLQQRNMYQGVLTADTTHYNNASDGSSVTPASPNLYSWKVVTTANAKPATPFLCFAIEQWVTAGTYAASKVFISSATAALKTNDVFVDVQYLGASYALGSSVTSFGATSQIPGGTTPGTLASASPAWGTSGLGNDYQLAIPSFTTSADGYVRFYVKVGKASLTVYIDPAVTVA